MTTNALKRPKSRQNEFFQVNVSLLLRFTLYFLQYFHYYNCNYS